jgi:HEPN domain-containing protein
VVECALKSLWQLETGQSPKYIHDLGDLARDVSTVATVAGAKTARYYRRATSSVSSSAISAWRPEMRYRSPAMTLADAQAWCQIADGVFLETIAQMRLDGVL